MVVRRRRAPAAQVPTFALYGEADRREADDMLHIESIQSRSSRHAWEIDPHVHRGLHQIVWLQTGPAEVDLDGLKQRCAGPVLVVIPPGAVHGFRFGADSDGQVLTLSPRLLLEGGQDLTGEALRALFAEPRLWPVPGDEVARLGALFSTLLAEFHAPGDAGSPVPIWLARALVWRLAQLAARDQRLAGAGDRGAARGEQVLFTRFLVLLEAHHAEHWPVSRYADRLGLTPERLNRLVREATGHSTMAVVHGRLLREACRRLVYAAAPISSVAFELGFDDPAYFCRFFKRHTGLSPRAFRQRPAT